MTNARQEASQEVEAVMARLIRSAKELGLVARDLSKEALDIELRGLTYGAVNVSPGMVNRCRLADDELARLAAYATYLHEAAQSLKNRLYDRT